MVSSDERMWASRSTDVIAAAHRDTMHPATLLRTLMTEISQSELTRLASFAGITIMLAALASARSNFSHAR